MKRIWLIGLACLLTGLLAGTSAPTQAQGGGGVVSPGGIAPPATFRGPAPAPPIEEGTGAISGVVIDGATKAPIVDAVVYLGNNGSGVVGSQNRQVTDAKGRFAFVNLPAKGTLTIGATKPGYLPGGFNRDNRAGTSNGLINLREGEWVSDLQILLSKPGTISGTVTDERGEPVVGVFVRVLARLRNAGTETLAGGPMVKTDDRGMYRVPDLAPGRYVVVVPSVSATVPASVPMDQQPAGRVGAAGGAPPVAVEPILEIDPQARLVLRNYPTPPPPTAGARFGYPITFHPGTNSVGSAATIDLKFGDDRSNVDIALQPVTTWRVSGVVQGPPESLANLTLRLIPQGFERLGHGSEAGTAYVGADGQFAFLNVPDGTYTIDAPRTFNELRVSYTARMLGPGGFPPPPRPGSMGWGSMSSGLDVGPPGIAYEERNFGSRPNYFGRGTVTVAGRDETGVVLPLRTTGTMSGRIRIDGATEPVPGVFRADPPTMMRLDPANGDPSRGPLRPERVQTGGPPSLEFTIAGLIPGGYFLRLGMPWSVKTISWQGRDYTDVPFDAATNTDISGVEVVVTDLRPTITGTIRNSRGEPAEGATVVAFPADESLWTNRGLLPSRMASGTASRTGTYRISSLPAGDYVVVTVDPSQIALKFEPEFFRASLGSAGATRVTLAWGETRTVDVSVR